MNEVMLYGAGGYTGQLCARTLRASGIAPMLAGRGGNVATLARELGCNFRIFDLEGPAPELPPSVRVLVNLAGPFHRTQKPLIRACIKAGCHYLDIAGEVREMESAFEFDMSARRAGVMLMPGAGFGVVPTDIAACLASEALPGASHLQIAFAALGGVSRGTLQTLLRDIDKSGVKRIGRQLQDAWPAESEMQFAVGGRTFRAVSNPWRGDLFTVGLSTGIANVETFSVFPRLVVWMMRGKLAWLRGLLRSGIVKFLPDGPSPRQRRNGSTWVQARASNGEEQRTVSLQGPEAYLFTAHCVSAITGQVLLGNASPGFQPPSRFGKALLDSIPGVEWYSGTSD